MHVHSNKRTIRALMLGVLMLGIVGCESIGGSSTSGSLSAMFETAPQPADTGSAFITAWGARDYPAMYDLLSVESKGLYTLPTFQAIYEQADAQIGTTGAAATILNAHTQGITAAITYDVTLQSSLFGEISDPGRTMRLIQNGETWRVAWTTMDIFQGYAPGATLAAGTRRPPRGDILDRDGQPMVDQGGEVISLFNARQEVSDYEGCLDLLARLLLRSRAELAELYNSFNAETIFAVGDIDSDVYAANEAQLLSLCNIRTDTRTTRRYVGHGIASHVIGYVGQISAEQLERLGGQGYQEGDLVGFSGIEEAYEAQLAGEPERFLRITDPGGVVLRELAGAPGTQPQSVTLTLDLELQWAAAQALNDAYNYAVTNWASPEHSPGGGVVVLDVDTGGVLAMASYPSFDPGIFGPDTPIFFVGDYISALTTDPRRPFVNRVTQNSYAPGSTFKIVTLAAAAEENLWQRDELFFCDTQWQGQPFGDTQPVRLDWRATENLEENRFATGEVTMAEALMASCNPFFYQMGAELFNTRGASMLIDYARRMGFGRNTGFGTVLPEVAGQLPDIRSVEQSINTAIGQDDTQVTILQMARMMAALGNGGTLYRPYVVQQVGGGEGVEPSFVAQPQVEGQLNFSDETMALLEEAMCSVTTQERVGRTTGRPLGTAWFVFDQPEPEGVGEASYTVCGKTGTAQTGRIEPHGWFVAYAPADDPQIAVAAMIEHGREGSETAAPIVRRVLDAYFGTYTAPYPFWWTGEYDPMTIPVGATGG